MNFLVTIIMFEFPQNGIVEGKLKFFNVKTHQVTTCFKGLNKIKRTAEPRAFYLIQYKITVLEHGSKFSSSSHFV